MSVEKKYQTRPHKPELPTLVYGKVPPQSKELEEAVLGACMLEKDTFEQVIKILPSAECFYDDAHQKIYRAMVLLNKEGTPIDLLTITDRLRRLGTLEDVGNAYYISKLTMAVLSSAHVEAHARIVMEKFMMREVIRHAGGAIAEAYDESADVFDVVDKLNNEVHRLATAGVENQLTSVKDTTNSVLMEILGMKDKNLALSGIQTGFTGLNDITSGWQRTDVIVIAARPGVGKTAFVVNSSLGSAADKEYGAPVLIVSLEVPAAQLIKRMLAAISGVLFERIMRKQKLLTPIDIQRLQQAAEILSKLPIYIKDDIYSISQFEAQVKHFKKKHNVGLVVLDYLQLMNGDHDRGDNRDAQIGKMTRRIKQLAKNQDIAILELSQMSREYGKQEDREPQLTDLRESGSIEQDADAVMFLYRPTEKDLQKKPNLRGYILGSLKKHRNGENNVYAIFHCNNRLQRWVCSSFTKHDSGKPVVIQFQNFHIKPIEGDDVLTAEEIPKAFTQVTPPAQKKSTGFQQQVTYVPGETNGEAVDDLPF